MKFILISMMICLTETALAVNEFSEFYRGVRPMAMGNAFVALADDADAVFYNPAGIALNSGAEIRYFNPKFEVSKDVVTLSSELRSLSSSGFNADALKALFGKSLSGTGTIYPSVRIPYLTLGYYAGFNFHTIMNNQALPRIDLNYYYDQGIVGGSGFEVPGFGKQDRLRLGTTLKALYRAGVSRVVPVTTLVTGSGVLKSLTSDTGFGLGVDVGFQYEVLLSPMMQLIVASAWQDIGETHFGGRLADASRPPINQNNLSIGAALVASIGRSKNMMLRVTGETRHVTQTAEDSRKKIHFGTEFQVGPIAVQLGANQLNWTAGITADLFVAEIAASTYAVEALPLWGMTHERRYALQLSLKLDATTEQSTKNRDWDRKKRPNLYR